MMILGKLGPLALIFSFSKPKAAKVTYPEGDILCG
jgi:hypothetical protein